MKQVLNDQKKEDCAHAIWEYKSQGFYVTDRWHCNIGNIKKCKACKKFYRHDWNKEDHEL